MEISPIPGIRALPAARASQSELRPPSFFDVIASAKAGDGDSQRSRRKAAGAEENDAENDSDDLMLDDDTEPEGEAGEEVASRQIDYFA